MVHVNVGTDEKLATLTDSEFRCHVAGVLAIAAKSPVRGRLLVGEAAAEAVHIARSAAVSKAVVYSCLAKLKDAGVLVYDEGLSCWAVHDFEGMDSASKPDRTGAERARRYRDRRKTVTPASRRVTRDVTRDDRDASRVTSRVTTVTVKEVPETPGPLKRTATALAKPRPLPLPRSSSPIPPLSPLPPPPFSSPSPPLVEERRLCALLAELIVQRDPKSKAPLFADKPRWLTSMRLLIADRGGDVAEVERVLRWCQADPFWQSNVLSAPKLREQFEQLLGHSATGVEQLTNAGDSDRFARFDGRTK
jgi:hypothetical protein